MWGREHHLYSHGCWLWTYYSTSVTLANDNTSVQTAQLSAARTSMGWLTTSLSINPFGPDRTWSRVEQTGTLCSSRFKMTSNPSRITPSHTLPNLENRKILKKTPNPSILSIFQNFQIQAPLWLLLLQVLKLRSPSYHPVPLSTNAILSWSLIFSNYMKFPKGNVHIKIT